MAQRRMDLIDKEWRKDFVECVTEVQVKERMNGSKITDLENLIGFVVLWETGMVEQGMLSEIMK